MSQSTQPNTRHSFAWGKVAGMIFATGIPAGLVIAANENVFPDSSWLATGMVITTFGVACIFAVASGYATPKVKKYVLIASVVLAVELAANLAVHWVLARQVSGAKQATTARHEEEDRAETKAQADFIRQKELLEQQRALAAETAKQLRMEAIRNDSARRLGIRAPRGATVTAPPAGATIPVSTPGPVAEPEVAAKTAAPIHPPLSVEEVMGKWTGWLLFLAVLDLLTSVVAFGICALLWEWDLDGDGIADHLKQGRGSTVPAKQAGFVYAQKSQEQSDPKA